jgi:hypothetical protein
VVLLAVILALAAGGTMAALAGARRADSALERLGAATGQGNLLLVPVPKSAGSITDRSVAMNSSLSMTVPVSTRIGSGP